MFRDISYCDDCEKKYETKIINFSNTVSPYKIYPLLQSKNGFSNLSELEANTDFPCYKNQVKVEIRADHCPQCYNAIVDGVLTFKVGLIGKEEREMIFYSDFWSGSIFKKVFPIAENTKS